MAKPLALFSGGGVGLSHMEARRDLLRGWAADPWAFLTGEDLDGTPIIVTQDESDERTPIKAFPTDKPYLRGLTNELFGPVPIVLIDKSRQMMVSTLCMLLMYWTILFKRGRVCFLSKQTGEEAEKMLALKVKNVHDRTPAWFREALPVEFRVDRATAIVTNSWLSCVGQNAATRAFKGNTASIVMIDEAAVQEFLEDMLEAAMPMAARIWVPTTAFHGNPGAAFFYKLKTEA